MSTRTPHELSATAGPESTTDLGRNRWLNPVDRRDERRDGVPVRVAVLGPLLVDGDPSSLGRRDRVVLAALTLRLGEPVRTDTLADALWGEQPPASAGKVLQGCVLRLRRTLGGDCVETVAGGYRLVLRRDDVDALVLEDDVQRARALLTDGEPDRAGYLLDRASGLWRGDPYPDLADWEPAFAERQHLVELRHDVDELRAQVQLDTGDHEAAVPALKVLVAEDPVRERRWELLALAEYRSGRQADALDTTRRARRVLGDELGLDVGPGLQHLEEALLRQDASLAAPEHVDAIGECPYRGLLAYDVDDSEAFFGREVEVSSALRTLDRAGVLAVVGPSGSGKSSLVRAGVGAALARDGRQVLVTTPGGAWVDVAGLDGSAALVVDQFEEVFDAPADRRARVLRDVESHVGRGGRLVLGLRADRMGELAGHPVIARFVEAGLHLLGGMGEDELRRAVTGPALQAGLRLEPGLVDLLVREVEGEPAALPLLSHVLRETWLVREGRTLTVAGYLSTGGVQGAIARTAEAVFDDLDPEDRTLLKQLMTRLVTTGDEGLPMRRRISRSGVDSDPRRHALVERLLAARLVSSDGATVEIAHEALTQAWPRLRSWLDEDVEGLQLMRHLSVAAETWDQAGRPESELYRGQREVRAAQWRAGTDPDLTTVERDFLDASAALVQRERDAAAEQVRRDRVANRRLRIGITVVLLLALVATAAGVVAATSARRATQAAVVADARRLGSEALRAKDLDTSLLYAVAAMRLDDSGDTQANLLAAIDKVPSLVTMARTPSLTSMSIISGGDRILVQSNDNGLVVVDRKTLSKVERLPELAGSVAISAPDGSFAAVTRSLNLVRKGLAPIALLDGSARPASRQFGGIPAGRYAFQDLSISPDSRHVAVLLHSAVDLPPVIGVWDVRAPGKPVALIHDPPGQSPLVDATGRRMFLVGDEGLSVLDLPSGHLRTLLTPEDLRVQRIDPVLALSPDGRVLAIAAGPQVVLLDSSTLAQRALIDLSTGADRLQFSPSGHRLAVSGETTAVLDVAVDGDPEEVFSQSNAGAWAGFSSDESTLFTADFDGSIRAWDLDGARHFLPVARAQGGVDLDEQWASRMSRDGSVVLRCGFRGEPGFVVGSADGGTTSRFTASGMVPHGSLDCAISPDGRLVTMTTSDPRVAVWSSTGDLVTARTLKGDEGAASFSWFTDDGGLVVGTTSGRLLDLDARTLAPRRDPIAVTDGEGIFWFTLRPGTRQVLVGLRDSSVVVDLGVGTTSPSGLGFGDLLGGAYSPDGTRLVVTTRGGSVGLYDAVRARWLSTPTDAQPFASVDPVFSDDGGEIAISASGRVGRWNGRTGAFLGAVTVGEDSWLRYSADGRRLLIAGQSGGIYTWDLHASSWIAAACRMAGRDLTAKEWAGQLPDRERRPVCPQSSAAQALPGDAGTLPAPGSRRQGRMGITE